MNRTSLRRKHKLRIILDNKDNDFYNVRLKEGNSTIRVMEKGFTSPAAIDINKNVVTIFIWGEKPIALKIKDKVAAASFQTYFEFLWNMAKK